MPKIEFNPGLDPSEVTHIIQERARLREGIEPISGQILDMAEIDNPLNEEFEEIREKFADNINNVDLAKGDLKALKENGFKHDGENSFLISPVSDRDWYSDHYLSCTAVVAIGTDAQTGRQISFLSHQDPEYFIDGGSDQVKNFSHELSARLNELKRRSQKDTFEVVLLGGNFNPSAKSVEYIHRHYRQSIEKLRRIVQETLGFDPKVLAGPNSNVGSETVVAVETQKRKVWVERSKQLPEFDRLYQANRLDEAEKNWLKAA